jgi:hypothetical protein
MAACATCLDTGYIEVEHCTCGGVPLFTLGIPGFAHQPMCGTEPCPEGCQP